MINISRAEILEVLDTSTLKVIRATIDPRTANNITGDSSPHPGNIALLLQPGDDPDDLLIIGIDNGIANISQPGEKRSYSYDAAGNVLASVYLNKDAEVVLNEGADWAVQYTALATAFNKLQSEFNDMVNKFNLHIHVTTATIGATATLGVISPTATPGTPSTADITAAKIEKVRVP